MKCPRCHHENPTGMKFCGQCAAPLASICPSCGAANPPENKFCGQCAAPLLTTPTTKFAAPDSYTPKHLAERILTSRAALEGERKQVTVLFADLKGSMELLADRDPEHARKILDPVLEQMMEAVHRYEGTVNQVMGDGIMALFGAPLAHEDHAVRACYAALRMQESVARYAEGVRTEHGIRIRIRVGLNSGEVVVRAIGSDLHMDYTAVGQITHLAARMEQLADPGSTLLTPATLALAEGFVQVTSLGPMAVKGLPGPVEVYALLGISAVRSRLQAAAARGLSPFVGRDTEVEQLRRAVEQARQGRGQVVAIVGEPGVGKSRLTFELTHSHRVEGWLVLEAGASSHGKATSYLPLATLLRSYFKLGERDTYEDMRARISARLSTLGESLWPAAPAFEALLGVPVEDARWQGLEPRQLRQHTLEALRHLILRESQVQPLLLIVEDLHWIDAETQAWLDGLVDGLPAAQILVVATYRPEYQHFWGSRTYYTQLRVDPLPRDGAEELLQAILGTDAGLASLRTLLIQRTDGNPFFLEESVRTLVETKALEGGRGAYRLVQPIDHVRVPATVQAILASRIDRLPPAEKQLLQSAAVIGKDVPFILLHAIADDAEEGVRRQIAVLQSAEFLYETRLIPDSEYTFKHALTQEVAYGSLLTDRRRAIHARIVETIERLQGDRLGEQVERLAHHALRAELWEKARLYGRQAGAKAMARWALRDAGIHLERALAATTHLVEAPEAIEQAIDVRLDLRNAIFPLGEVERALGLMREAKLLAERLSDETRIGTVSLSLSASLWMLGHSAEAQDTGERALAIAEALDDRSLRHQARGQLGRLHHTRGDYRQASAVIRDALSALEPAGISPIALTVTPSLVATSNTYLAWSLAELGEFAEAKRRAEESLRRAEALGSPLALMMACMGVGMVHLRQGNALGAMPPLEQGLQVCYTFGFTALTFHGIAASLGAAYALANRTAEAIPLLRKVADQSASMKLISDHLLGAIPLAEVWLSTGRTEDAAQLGRQALDLARRHKQRGHEVYALRLLGEVAARREPADVQEAEAHYCSAIALAHDLGMRPLAAHCHLGLGRLYRRTGRRQEVQEHLAIAATMYREMEMPYWLEQADSREEIGMMDRRVFITSFAVGALMAARSVDAQQARGRYRIGWLSPASAADGLPNLEALRAGLRELGYVEGQNIAIELRWANGRTERLPQLAAELVRLPVDVFCTAGSQASAAAKQSTSTIPIVFANVAFPDQTGLVASYPRPGGNITGVAFIGPEYGKRLELLKLAFPKLARVALIYNPENRGSVLALEETQRWAAPLGVTLEPHTFRGPDDFEQVFGAITGKRPDALMTTADPLIHSYRKRIVDFAAKHRLPSMFPGREFVNAGGLMFYGGSISEMYRYTAVYVDKILKGARPGELPVDQPTKFDMVINLKTARALGLTIPPSLLLRADHVIE